MKIIFIAAGSSTRLGKLTLNFPKGLIKINNNSIIGTQIDLFKNKNFNGIIIITGPNSDKFDFDDVIYINDINHMKHDVLGSLMVAKSYMNDEIITTYSDIVFDEKILNSIIEFTGDFGIAVDLNWKKKYVNRDQHPKSEADNVVIDNENILKIRKNITKCEDNQVIGEFLGLMKLSKNGAKIFKDKYSELENQHKGKFHSAPSLEKAYLTDMLQELINSGIKISPILVNGNWWEIDTLQDLEMAKKILK
jgi:choline kinase